MNKTTVCIKGMHCRSCEILLEDELSKIKGVHQTVVRQKTGTAEIWHEGELNQDRIKNVISNAGYSLGRDEKKPLISKNWKDYEDLLKIGIMLFLLYIIVNSLGLFNINLRSSNNYSSLPIVLLIGLTAGFSTCMALVGGLVLGASARFAEQNPGATALQKFKPHVFFNIGRIASFFVLGALIGFAGSFFQLSTVTLGFLTIIVGAVMLLLGLQLTEIFPRLNSATFTLPKSVSRFFGIKETSEKEYSHKNSMVLGALTFFLPCGFTQAMQLYAISTGNPLAGALTMGTFAIGTAPGLLGIGGLTSVVKDGFAKIFFKTAGVVVIFLALFNISNGYNLSGLNLNNIFPFRSEAVAQTTSDPNVTLENGVQTVRMTQTGGGYSPNFFTIKKGIPVRWVIDSQDANSCAASIVMPTFGIRKSLQFGGNIIEFTAAATGTIKFSCIMGMYTGSFNVVDEGNVKGDSAAVQFAAVQPPTNKPQAAASCGGGGGGCGCGQKAARREALQNDQTPVSQASQEGTVQLIKTTYTNINDIQPNKFSVKAGIPVRMEVEAQDDGAGCMGSIMVPGFTSPEILTKGKTVVFNFTPSRPGQYEITCAMGVPRGVINVE